MNEPIRPAIVVVGSLHYDIMVDAPDRPRKGETVTGYAWRPKFGGKGGNQAVAAARAGAEVRMAGAIGDDDFGPFLLDHLNAAGVDCSRIERLSGVGSGMSVAIADSEGDYGAVIVSGANLKIDLAALAEPDLWQGVRMLILQNEVPEAVNIHAARAARSWGVIVCVNAAPYRPFSPEFVDLIDVLVVNAIEAEQLGSVPVVDLASAAQAAAFLSQNFATVVVTAGGDGVAGQKRGETPIRLPAKPVDLISTHGAGDVFVGALASSLANDLPFSECIAAANEAASLHVSTRHE
jgi:ribokinase